MKWAVVTDSSSDMAGLKEQIKEETNGHILFDTVALKIEAGDVEFIDDENLDTENMVDYLKSYQGKTGSASPSPQEWYDIFEQADMCIAITITGAMSGSYRSACAAKDMIAEDYPDKKIYVMDSMSTGPELMLLTRRAITYAMEDIDFDTMVKRMNNYKKMTHLYFVLETMDNLIKKGRVDKFEAGVASMLGIKVMGRASSEGTLEVVKKSRGKTKVYDKLIEDMLEYGYIGGNVIISHCHNEAMAGYLKLKIIEKYPESHVTIVNTGGLCSFYAQERGVLVGYERIEA